MRVDAADVDRVSGISRPAVRAALLWVWLITIAESAIDGELVARTSTNALALGLLLVAIMLVTAPRAGGIVPWLVLVSALLTAALGLIGASPPPFTWIFTAASTPLVLLAPRGHPIVAAVGLGVYVALAAAWGIAGSLPTWTVLDSLASPLATALFAYLWLIVAVVVVQRERAALSAGEVARVRSEAAAAARARTIANMSSVSGQVTPALKDLADGVEIDEPAVRMLVVVEGDVRDRVRATALRETTLSSAVASARWRGVRVTMLSDEDGEDLGRISDRVVERVVALLQDPRLVRITVRRLPPGRRGAVTAVAVREDATERITLDDHGNEI